MTWMDLTVHNAGLAVVETTAGRAVIGQLADGDWQVRAYFTRSRVQVCYGNATFGSAVNQLWKLVLQHSRFDNRSLN